MFRVSNPARSVELQLDEWSLVFRNYRPLTTLTVVIMRSTSSMANCQLSTLICIHSAFLHRPPYDLISKQERSCLYCTRKDYPATATVLLTPRSYSLKAEFEFSKLESHACVRCWQNAAGSDKAGWYRGAQRKCVYMVICATTTWQSTTL